MGWWDLFRCLRVVYIPAGYDWYFCGRVGLVAVFVFVISAVVVCFNFFCFLICCFCVFSSVCISCISYWLHNISHQSSWWVMQPECQLSRSECTNAHNSHSLNLLHSGVGRYILAVRPLSNCFVGKRSVLFHRVVCFNILHI